MLLDQHGKKPGSWATVKEGFSFAGRTARVVDFFPEEQDNGIPVEGGLKYFVLQMGDVDGKVAFLRHEIRIRR